MRMSVCLLHSITPSRRARAIHTALPGCGLAILTAASTAAISPARHSAAVCFAGFTIVTAMSSDLLMVQQPKRHLL